MKIEDCKPGMLVFVLNDEDPLKQAEIIGVGKSKTYVRFLESGEMCERDPIVLDVLRGESAERTKGSIEWSLKYHRGKVALLKASLAKCVASPVIITDDDDEEDSTTIYEDGGEARFDDTVYGEGSTDWSAEEAEERNWHAEEAEESNWHAEYVQPSESEAMRAGAAMHENIPPLGEELPATPLEEISPVQQCA